MQEQRHIPKILAAGWVAACASAVALGQALRLGPAEAAYALPLSKPLGWLPPLLLPLALVLIALTAGLLLLGSAHARARGLQKPWARLLLVHPLLLAFIWLVWPATGRQPWTGVAAIPLLLAAMGIAIVMILGPRKGYGIFGPLPRWGEFRRDAIFLLIIVGAGIASGKTVTGGALLSAAIFYPLFALVQMSIMLILPAGDLQRCGLSGRWTATACALVFGLLHWPNPLVAVATALAMFFWTQDRLAGRSLISLALGMGFLGAGFSQMLPDAWTAHMRIGPGYVRRLVREDLVDGHLWFAKSQPHWDQHNPLPEEFLEALYPGVIGRPLSSPELAVWESALDRARRKTVIWQFLTSVEYERKQTFGPPPPAGEMDPDTRLHWQKIISTLDSQSFWESHGSSWSGFIAELYQNLLDRKASPAELSAWSPRLNIIQRRQILEVMLGHAFQWRDQPPPTLPINKLVVPQVPILVDRF